MLAMCVRTLVNITSKWKMWGENWMDPLPTESTSFSSLPRYRSTWLLQRQHNPDTSCSKSTDVERLGIDKETVYTNLESRDICRRDR